MCLREPADVGAAVHHALLRLQHDAHLLAVARRVAHRHLAIGGRRHEGVLDAALYSWQVRSGSDEPEALGPKAAGVPCTGVQVCGC